MSSTSESTFLRRANGTQRGGCLRGGLSPMLILCVVIEVVPSSDMFNAKTSENSMTNEWSSSHSVTCISAVLRSRAVHNSSSCPLQPFSLVMATTLGMFGWSSSIYSMRVAGCISPRTSPSCSNSNTINLCAPVSNH